MGATIEANPELTAFVARIDAAQEEFAQGRPAAFKALWSHTDDATLCGGLGGIVEHGWMNVAARLDWASNNYADAERSNQTIAGFVDGAVAYLVRKEIIEAKIGNGGERSRQELRVTMVFRHGVDGWRIVHRHADSQTSVSAKAKK
jgi:ketosteroid isomerase-like protein